MSYYESAFIKIDNDTIKYDAQGQLIARGGGGGGDASIDDQNITTTTTYSSSKTESRLTEMKEEIDEEYGGTVLSYNDTLAVLGVPPSPFYQYRRCTPVMTANNQPPNNICSASSEYTGHEAYKAFRQTNDGDGWMSQNNDVVNAWIRYQFAEPKVIGRITIKNFATSSPAACKKFIFQATNNTSSWIDLATCNVTSSANGAVQSFDIENNTTYAYYRLFIKEGYDVTNVAFGQIDLMEKYVA